MSAPAEQERTCTWTSMDPEGDSYDTACGQAFTLTGGTPAEHRMAFCCYCGGRLMTRWPSESERAEHDRYPWLAEAEPALRERAKAVIAEYEAMHCVQPPARTPYIGSMGLHGRSVLENAVGVIRALLAQPEGEREPDGRLREIIERLSAVADGYDCICARVPDLECAHCAARDAVTRLVYVAAPAVRPAQDAEPSGAEAVTGERKLRVEWLRDSAKLIRGALDDVGAADVTLDVHDAELLENAADDLEARIHECCDSDDGDAVCHRCGVSMNAVAALRAASETLCASGSGAEAVVREAKGAVCPSFGCHSQMEPRMVCVRNPTHWMPLPTAPGAPEEATERSEP